jgi:CubicO group peptidase (beta-lactamase class C family)
MTAAMTMNRRDLLTVVSGASLLAAAPAWPLESGPAAHAAYESRLVDIVARFMREFEIPGIGLGVVLPNRPQIVQGHGVRTLGRPEHVDARTRFAIASNSKAFLAACLALLVDEGKLGWDDPVVKHLPEFRMYDPAVTAMMTVRDLLVHRSGLPLGAGDLMQFPRTDHTREEILRALPHFKPATGFRAGYAYDNCLYIVAGILIERCSGLEWDRFVAKRIFEPLAMADAVANATLVSGANQAGRHARLGPPIRGMGKLEVIEQQESAVLGPAGGINVSAVSVIPWLRVQLERGALPDGRRLWSEAQSAEMWQPQTLISSGPGPSVDMPHRAVIQAYALGWGVSDYRGQRMLSHGGGLAGQVTRTALLPDLGVGLIVYSNSEEEHAVSALRYALIDHLLGTPEFDWIAAAKEVMAAERSQVLQIMGSGDFPVPAGAPSLPLDRYVGRYRDPWYGDVVLALKGGKLAIDFTRTPAFKSLLEPFGVDAFRTRFPRGAGEDAVITFAVKEGVVTGITMKALSPLADFSFDFHDLAFVPVRS